MTHSASLPVTRRSRITAEHRPVALQALRAAVAAGPFESGAPAPCQVPVHDMNSLGRYRRTLPVFENGETVKWVNAEDRPDTYRTNPELADGDKVVLLEHATVDGYWFDPGTMARGSYLNHHVLAGSVGVVVKARTPWVSAPRNTDRYFANVDVPMSDGTVSRVRVAHTALKREPTPPALLN